MTVSSGHPAVPVQDRGTVRVRAVTDGVELAGLHGKWDDLLAACPSASPFQSLEWLLACWRAYGAGRGLRVLVAERGEELAAALPLIARKAGPFEVLSFLGHPRSDFVDALVRPGEEEALDAVLGALAEARDWDLLWLEDLDEGAVLQDRLARLAAGNAWGLASRPGTIRPYARLGRTWEEYLTARSKKFRWNLRRDAQRLAAAGEAQFEWRLERSGAGDEVALMSDVEARSWKVEARATRVQSPNDVAFTEMVLKSFSMRGWAALAVLRLAGMPIAYLLEFRFGKKVLAYNTAFDASLSHVSPGTLLFARSIETACRAGALEADFLRGDEVYKSRWTEDHRTNLDTLVWRGGLRGPAAAWWCARLRWTLQQSGALRWSVSALRRMGARTRRLAQAVRRLRGGGAARGEAASEHDEGAS